jgi:nickel/cobalt transporter (NiCoT) family protein
MLILVVFALGAKHGMDPDHLATIDGLARCNTERRPRLARWSGCLFSLGHGLVVTLVAALAASLSGRFSVPTWLEHAGAWIAIAFLVALGVANIAAVWRTPRDRIVRGVGLRARWLPRLARAQHPVLIASVGALFALSIDTWSQTVVFSLAAQQMAGWTFSVALGLIFTAGMMVADGINGWWVARMLAKADRRALIASRVMSLVIGTLSLAIAGISAARYFAPGAGVSLENVGTYAGLTIVALLTIGFLAAMRIAASGRAPS